MTNSIWDKVADTPWWVYILFIYLMNVGIAATKPHVVSIRRLCIVPALFFTLPLITLFNAAPFTRHTFIVGMGAVLLGIFLGWLQFLCLKIKAIKNEPNLYLPGTWGPFVIILVFFAVQYYYGSAFGIDQNLLHQARYASFLFVLVGFCVGLYIGRIAYSLRCVKVGPYL